MKRDILKTRHEIRHSNFSIVLNAFSSQREVEADEAVQVALSTSALSQCFKGGGGGGGEMKAGDMSSLIGSEDEIADLLLQKG